MKPENDPDDGFPISREAIEQIRKAGFVIVPVCPSQDMKAVGAPSCFQCPDGDWDTACRDAEDCYRAMIETGCL